MKKVLRSSAQARQCVVLTIMEHNREIRYPEMAPRIDDLESCTEYHRRCLRESRFMRHPLRYAACMLRALFSRS